MNTLASSGPPAAILYRPFHLLHAPRATWLVDDEQAADILPPPISPLPTLIAPWAISGEYGIGDD